MPETPTTQGYKALIKKLKKKLEHNYELLENKDMRGGLNDIEKVLRDKFGHDSVVICNFKRLEDS